MPRTTATSSILSLLGRSQATVAVICFLFLNFSLAIFYRPSFVERIANFNHTAAWYALKGRLEAPNADVILLGSSLVRQAVAWGDAAYLNRPVDQGLDRRSIHLEDCLSELTGRPIRTCSLSWSGQFPSDAFAFISTIRPTSRTKLAIYGIAPRDFFNTQLSRSQIQKGQEIAI